MKSARHYAKQVKMLQSQLDNVTKANDYWRDAATGFQKSLDAANDKVAFLHGELCKRDCGIDRMKAEHEATVSIYRELMDVLLHKYKLTDPRESVWKRADTDEEISVRVAFNGSDDAMAMPADKAHQ